MASILRCGRRDRFRPILLTASARLGMIPIAPTISGARWPSRSWAHEGSNLVIDPTKLDCDCCAYLIAFAVAMTR